MPSFPASCKLVRIPPAVAAAVLSIFFLYLYLSFCLDSQPQADNLSGPSVETNQQTLCGHPIPSLLWK